VGLRLSSGALSRLRTSLSLRSRAALSSSSPPASLAALGSSGALWTTAEEQKIKKQLDNGILNEPKSKGSAVVSQPEGGWGGLGGAGPVQMSLFSPAFWGRTTSTAGLFKEAISAALRLFRSVSALSRLNTHTHTHPMGSLKSITGRRLCCHHVTKTTYSGGSVGNTPGQRAKLPLRNIYNVAPDITERAKDAPRISII